MRVHVAADHAAFEVKNELAESLRADGHEVVDHGAFRYESEDDYPPIVLRAAEAVARDPGSLGIVLGGSGNGEQIAANKVAGIRAALGWSEQTARLARSHNDANILAVGARQHEPADIRRLVATFMSTEYENEDRHARRIEMISRYEEAGAVPPPAGSR